MDSGGYVCRVDGPDGAEPGMGYLRHRHDAAPPLMVLQVIPPAPSSFNNRHPSSAEPYGIAWQNHPSLGLLAAKCSYCPTFFPIWGNGRTFSWEPYLVRAESASFAHGASAHLCVAGCSGQERSVGGGMVEEWTIDYEFGMPASSASRAKL